MTNPIKQKLEYLQVELPAAALDLSKQLREASITRPYIIVMTGRCGSTWLASALSKVPGYGNPIEYYSDEGLPYFWKYEGPQAFGDVFLGIAKKYSDHGKFGFKINPQRLFWLNALVDLPKTFATDNTAWIDMRRWNLVKQALSFVVAKKTGLWHQYKGMDQRNSQQERLEITDLELWREILNILAAEQEIDKFYSQHAIKPLRIWHEEIFDSKASLLIRVLKFIDPRVDLNNLEFDGDTERLNKDSMIGVERNFLRKYAVILNEIYINRSSIDVYALKENLKEIVA